MVAFKKVMAVLVLGMYTFVVGCTLLAVTQSLL